MVSVFCLEPLAVDGHNTIENERLVLRGSRNCINVTVRRLYEVWSLEAFVRIKAHHVTGGWLCSKPSVDHVAEFLYAHEGVTDNSSCDLPVRTSLGAKGVVD